MFVDARTLPADAELDADVCIVGAGPAGIAVALQLMPTGARVLMLESGGITPEVLAKHLDIGSTIGYQYHNLMFTRARAFGGTTSRWHMPGKVGDEGWMARPLEPIDYEARPGVPYSGWPFGADHLEPFVHRAHAMSALGPDTYDTSDWERPGMRRLPLRDERVVTNVLQRGLSSFVRYREPFATAANVTVLYHATVVDLESAGEPVVVRRIQVATGPDRRFSVSARQVVLAAGGIENPRILLISRSHHPDGLGNGNDLVGRFFMEHHSARVGFVRPTRPSLVDEARLYDSHREGEVFIQGHLMLHPDVLRREGLRNAAFFLLPRTEAFVSEGVRSLKALQFAVYRRPWVPATPRNLRNVARDLKAVGGTAARALGRSSDEPTLLAMRVQAEQAPDPASRVTLGTARDRYGIPRVALDWRLSADDIESVRRSQDILDGELQAAGLGRIERKLGEEDPPVVFEGNHHHIGTTRMDVNERHGVVDADGRVHGVRNLHIAGCSVFPTGGYTNPTLTIVAMAIRLGDHLRDVIGAD